jgi:hypothetical protein
MYSVMLLGSDWFSAAVLRRIKRARHPLISSLRAQAKDSLLESGRQASAHEQRNYGIRKPLFPVVCKSLNVPILPYSQTHKADILLVASFGSLMRVFTIAILVRNPCFD